MTADDRTSTAWSRYLDSLPIADLFAEWQAGRFIVPAKDASNPTIHDFDVWVTEKFRMSLEDARRCRVGS